MRLHLIKTDKFKTTVCVLLLRTPLARETATVTALVPNVLARGSARYPGLADINRELEDMYGSVFEAQTVKKAEEQMVQLYLEFISGDERLKRRGLEFMCELLRRPVTEGSGFRRDYVAGEKANLSVAIASRINNKSEYAKQRALEYMFEGERFGVYGDGYLDEVEALTPETVYARYRELMHGATAELIVMGDEDETELRQQAREVFGDGNAQEQALPKPDTAFTEREPRVITERCEITQGKICMGYRTGARNTGADVYRLILMNELLGGGPGSKLFTNVREKANLCYYISSSVYRSKAAVLVQSGVETRNFDRTSELVREQVQAIADGKVTEAELANARRSLSKKLRGLQDSQSAMIDFHMSQYMLDESTDFEAMLEQASKPGLDEVCELASRMRLCTEFRLTGDQ